MFSKSCEYAIKAMIFIAQKSDEQKRVGVKEIAKGTATPEHFVAKILQELSKKRLVLSMKGPSGGFYMTNKELSSSISDIVKAIDGDGIYKDCVLGLKLCSEKNPCPIHHQYVEIKKNFLSMIETNTIIEFKDKLEKGFFFLKNE